MSKHRFLILLSVLVLTFAGTVVAQNTAWRLYCNNRFGFCLKHPATWLPDEPPVNGDGQVWRSKDGTIELRAYGYLFFADLYPQYFPKEVLTLDGLYRYEVGNGANLSFRLKRPTFFVLSGTVGQTIFYRKTMTVDAKDAVFATFMLTYPKSQKIALDSIVTTIANSFVGQ
jgi:hypothetical protein